MPANTMLFNKLVRDKIPTIINKNGEKPIIHIAKKQEFEKALFDKLQEEIIEFQQKPTKEEMADIFEVLYTLCSLKNAKINEIEKTRQKKAQKRGRFNKHIILERTE